MKKLGERGTEVFIGKFGVSCGNSRDKICGGIGCS